MHTYTYIYICVCVCNLYAIWYDIESRPVHIKCCLVASCNTAKLWFTHGYIHMIAKPSDQTPVLATSKSGPALKPCMQLSYPMLMNKKGAMVRDSNSVQSSWKADAARVDHVTLQSCFPLHSRCPQCTFFRAPNARHWTDQWGIEPHRHPIATWYISYINLKIDHGGHPIQLGKCLKMVRFEATAHRTPYSHFVRKQQLQPSLTAGFRNLEPGCKFKSLEAQSTYRWRSWKSFFSLKNYIVLHSK